MVKSVTLNVFVVLLRLEDRHSEAGDFHPEDVPFTLAMEEGAVGAGSEAEMQRTNEVFDATAHDSTDDDIYKVDTNPSLHLQRKERQPPILANVLLNGQPLTLEVDTGAATSLINEETYRKLWEEPPPLEPAHERLRSYLGEKIPLLGSAIVNVIYGDQSADVQVLIVQGKRVNLFGRDWLKEIRLDWGPIMKVGSMELEDTLNLYSDVFREELGEFKGTKVKIGISSCTATFLQARKYI